MSAYTPAPSRRRVRSTGESARKQACQLRPSSIRRAASRFSSRSASRAQACWDRFAASSGAMPCRFKCASSFCRAWGRPASPTSFRACSMKAGASQIAPPFSTQRSARFRSPLRRTTLAATRETARARAIRAAMGTAQSSAMVMGCMASKASTAASSPSRVRGLSPRPTSRAISRRARGSPSQAGSLAPPSSAACRARVSITRPLRRRMDSASSPPSSLSWSRRASESSPSSRAAAPRRRPRRALRVGAGRSANRRSFAASPSSRQSRLMTTF